MERARSSQDLWEQISERHEETRRYRESGIGW
jgi:hypothetical protein